MTKEELPHRRNAEVPPFRLPIKAPLRENRTGTPLSPPPRISSRISAPAELPACSVWLLHVQTPVLHPEIQYPHHIHRCQPVVPVSLASLLPYRIRRVVQRPVSEVSLTLPLHLHYELLPALCHAAHIEYRFPVFPGQTQLFRIKIPDVPYLPVRKQHLEKTCKYLLVYLRPEQPFEAPVRQRDAGYFSPAGYKAREKEHSRKRRCGM